MRQRLRQMTDGADIEAPVCDIRDPSYDELADLMMLILGTDEHAICKIQLITLEYSATNIDANGAPVIEAWRCPMKTGERYFKALGDSNRTQRG